MKMKIPKPFSATMQEDKVKGRFQFINSVAVELRAPDLSLAQKTRPIK